jgi:hypothetical protein
MTLTQTSKTLEEVLLKDPSKLGDPSQSQAVADPNKKNAILYAYMMILSAVHVSLICSSSAAKELGIAQSNMSKENDAQNNISFVLPDKDGNIQTKYTYQQSVKKYFISALCGNGTIGSSLTEKHTYVTSLADVQNLHWNLHSVMGHPNGTYFNDGLMTVGYKTIHTMHLRAMTQNDYAKLQMSDQQIEKERQYFSNKIVILQQCSQSIETGLGSKSDFLAQFIQEDTNFATVLTTIASQLGQMLRTP